MSFRSFFFLLLLSSLCKNVSIEVDLEGIPQSRDIGEDEEYFKAVESINSVLSECLSEALSCGTLYRERGIIYCENLGDYRLGLDDFRTSFRVLDYSEIEEKILTRYHRAKCFLKMNQTSRSKREFVRVVREYNRRFDTMDLDYTPDFRGMLYNSSIFLGNAFKNDSLFKEAFEYYETAIELDPDNPRAYCERAEIDHFTLKNYNRALVGYGQCLKLSPNRTDILNDRGVLYMKMGMKRQSLIDLNRAIEVNASDHLGYFNRAEVNRKERNHIESLEDYDESIRLKNECVECHFSRGLVYKHLFLESLAANRMVIKLDNETLSETQSLHCSLAMDDFDRTLELTNGEKWQVYQHKASILMMMFSFSEAIDALETGIEKVEILMKNDDFAKSTVGILESQKKMVEFLQRYYDGDELTHETIEKSNNKLKFM